MRKQSVPGSFLPAHVREPGNEADRSVEDIWSGKETIDHGGQALTTETSAAGLLVV